MKMKIYVFAFDYPDYYCFGRDLIHIFAHSEEEARPFAEEYINRAVNHYKTEVEKAIGTLIVEEIFEIVPGFVPDQGFKGRRG